MNKAIGIRLENNFLKKVEVLEKEEALNRSTVLRKLIYIGFNELMRKKAAEDYIKGKVTLSEAAYRAGLTIWEMENYLVERGFKSGYSLEDLNNEVNSLLRK